MHVDVVMYKCFHRLPSIDGFGPKKRKSVPMDIVFAVFYC